MKPVSETEERYCNADFEVIEENQRNEENKEDFLDQEKENCENLEFTEYFTDPNHIQKVGQIGAAQYLCAPAANATRDHSAELRHCRNGPELY